MSITVSAKTAACPIQLSSVLLKPELSDVQISVVGNEKEPKLFDAHKLLLAIASDVFKTMFFGSVPQENPVVIKDSNPAAFEAFLQFVYTGTTTVTEADIFPLLYLGKKYTLGSLVESLMNHLEECITSENVGQIVLAGQNFLDDAPPKFWDNVERHGEALLKSDEFLQLRKDTVHALLQLELEVEEKPVYDRAVAWAKAECVRNQHPVDSESVRSALEGILQHMRFTTMSAEEFARGPAVDAILTSEEKVQVLSWFAAAIPQSIFPDTARYDDGSYVCERLAVCYGNTPRNLSGSTEAIDFSVSRAVRVTGLSAYNFFSDGRSVVGPFPSAVAKLALGSVVLATKQLVATIDHFAQTIPITFDTPIKIEAGKRYTALVVVTGPSVYYGDRGNSTVTVPTKKGDVVFSFMPSDSSTNTNVDQGQIPQILFRV